MFIKKDFFTYKEAKKAVQELCIKTYAGYVTHKQYKRSPRLPSSPDQAYKNKGWVDWDDFLGIEKKFFLPYDEAKKIVKTFGIRTAREWWSKKNLEKRTKFMLPANAPRSYRNKGWVSWEDFLGRPSKLPSKFKSLAEAKRTVQELGLTTYTQYYVLKGYKKCKGLPANPNQVYKDKGWVSFADFLGKEK